MSSAYKSKTLACWIALLGGSLGLHRLYLHGWRDPWAWMHPWPTLLGLIGVMRLRAYGVDDRLAWLLLPLLGLMLSGTMLTAIIYGLTPDEKWNARFNAGGPEHRSSWSTVFGIALALMLGAAALVSTIAFSVQRLVEIEHEASGQPPR